MESAKRNSLPGRLLADVAELSPAYFGMVMATGIISLAAHWLGVLGIGHSLFVLNLLLYCGLWCLTALRLIFHPRRFFGDMVDHLRGPGFFTLVAGTCVLGSECIVLWEDLRAAMFLWLLAIAMWIALTYTIFAAFTIKKDKPSLDQGISGSWLLAVVATQSIAALSALIASHLVPPHKIAINFLALSMWLWGGMLYIWMISLIFYRYTFYPLLPSQLSPPYWINMGAMAISTLAGSLLIINSAEAPFLKSLLPFIKGFTIFYWATATWWIPMLLILALWRYVVRRFPLAYDPLYWGAVFPIGMYAAGTQTMLHATHLDFLRYVPRVFLYVGLVAWLSAFVGFACDLVRRLRGPQHVGRDG